MFAYSFRFSLGPNARRRDAPRGRLAARIGPIEQTNLGLHKARFSPFLAFVPRSRHQRHALSPQTPAKEWHLFQFLFSERAAASEQGRWEGEVPEGMILARLNFVKIVVWMPRRTREASFGDVILYHAAVGARKETVEEDRMSVTTGVSNVSLKEPPIF